MQNTGEILLRLDRLEGDMSRHSDKDEKAFKYTHNMLEDMGAKLSGLERSATRFEADVLHRSMTSDGIAKWLEKIDERTRTLERLTYIGIGGVLVLGGTFTIISAKILKLLAT